jgi:acyl-coenzyme A synthetase/AMP-(fatty) acid ligase
VPPALPLLADTNLDRILAWRDGRAVRARELLGQAQALAGRLPSAHFAVNLCEDRYAFLVAFYAAVLAGQTNLLPATRTPHAITETLRAYPDSYALAERVPGTAPARLFVIPRAAGVDTTAISIPAISADRIVAIGFTSGSTGQPKAHPKSWGGFCASTARNADLLCAQDTAPNLVATVPPQHMYGLELSVLLPLRSAAAIHTGMPFLPADIADALTQVPAPRILVTTPHHLRALLQADVTPPALAAIVCATAPLDATLATAAEQRYATQVIEVFGSTETCVIAHRCTAYTPQWQLYAGIELHPQPDGAVVNAPYFSAPSPLQDLVEVLDSGRFLLRGRNGDLLEIAGKRASLAEINRSLLAIPGVRDGVVFALDPDAHGIRRLAALAVAPDLCEADILRTLREVVDPAFLPRPLRRVAALPRNAVGKLPRAALLEALRAG